MRRSFVAALRQNAGWGMIRPHSVRCGCVSFPNRAKHVGQGSREFFGRACGGILKNLDMPI